MKLLSFLKKSKKELLEKTSMFNIDEEVLVLLGTFIRAYQKGEISFDDLKMSFNIYGYEIMTYTGGCVIVKNENESIYEIHYNEKLMELMAFYGDEESIKCMNAILDWKQMHGHEISKQWHNKDNKWYCKQRKFKKHVTTI